MPAALYKNLAWLPPAPEDFKAQCDALSNANGNISEALIGLAGYQLDNAALKSLANKTHELSEAGKDLSDLMPFKLGLVSNATTEMIVPALIATAVRHGILLEVIQTPFDQVVSETTNPDSALYQAVPDAILLAIGHRGLPITNKPGSDDNLAKIKAYYDMIRQGIQNGSDAVCIYQTIAPPPEQLFGNMDTQIAGTSRSIINHVNDFISSDLAGDSGLLLDAAGIAETVGLHHWHDPKHWLHGKLPFSQHFVPLYADHVCRIIGAIKGKSRKCLVLDLDNTIWGGVIGDDGLEGITLGQGDSMGEAFLAIQRAALDLRDRGIMLAISSKNDEQTAREAFQKHPEMLLKEEHITVFQANWEDKASNLKAIAKTLNIGLDALVFLDDNTAERALIRQELPQVAVPELPEDPAYFPRYLSASGFFESVSFSEEDLQRAEYYAANAKRAELENTIVDYDTYLKSLEMTATMSPFDEIGRKRITQLINKTNQFNLTTIRYTENDVERMEKDDDYFTLQVRLEDKFGDNGIVSAIICKTEGNQWVIDTWLMSCRVLKRQLENAVLQKIIAAAKTAQIQTLVGSYIPTERNALVADHYADLGFTQTGEENGQTSWELQLDSYITPDLPIEIVEA